MCAEKAEEPILELHPPVLIKANEPICRMPDPDSMGYVFLMPEGPRQINELGDVFYIKDARVPYHDHQIGYETFLIDGGRVETTINHKRCIAEKGDLVHIRPFVHHGFHHLDDDTIWREVFQEMEMYSTCNQRDILRAKRPEIMEDPEFRKRRLKRNGTDYRDMPIPRRVSKNETFQIRPKGQGLRTLKLPGATFTLKVGRWETDGVREIWEIQPVQGLTLHFDTPFASSPLYGAVGGRLKASLFDGAEEYIAGDRDFLHIPAYTPFSLTVLDEDCRIMAYNVQCELLNALEELHAGLTENPGRNSDWAWVEAVMRKYDCWLTGVDRKQEEGQQG